MSARRLMAATASILLLSGLMPPPASAQFTPRFSTKGKGTPAQWHVGVGATIVNLGDYTSEPWPVLEAPAPIFHARIGVAVPIKGESLFLLPEVEFLAASTKGEYIHPLIPGRKYAIPTVGQRGFSIMFSLVRALRQRSVLMGAGLGYFLLEHDPVPVRQMLTDGVPFHRDPFNHIGIGLVAHYARKITELAENRTLMLEGRYKVGFLNGNVSDRTMLLSEFQITLYLAFR